MYDRYKTIIAMGRCIQFELGPLKVCYFLRYDNMNKKGWFHCVSEVYSER